MLKLICLSLLMVFFNTEASAKIYQWKDENGKMHFSDKPPRQAQDKNIKVKTLKDSSYRVSDANASARVILYSTDWCGHCKRAKRYFKKHGIAFVEYDIEKDQAAKKRYDQFQGRGVPLILVGKKHMRGFSQKGFEKLYKKS